MSKRKRTFKEYLFTTAMTLFIAAGSLATIGAMRATPTAHLDQVVLGNIPGDTVELAIETGNEALIAESSPATPPHFFAILSEEDEEDESIGDFIAFLDRKEKRRR